MDGTLAESDGFLRRKMKRHHFSVGGVHTSGNAAFGVTPTIGVGALPDPLAGLVGPSPTGLTSYGSVSLTKGSLTINPGSYSQISASGNARLTLNPGTYIIEGGGLTVSGNAGISGSNVFIYNAGSNYPNSGGNFGGITLSGNGTFSLTAPTTGTYAGVLIYQSRQNTRAISLSGNASAGISGVVYAANALLTISGNGQLNSTAVLGTLNLSGNVTLTQMATGSDGVGDTAGIADTLVAGDLYVYINDPTGYFTADELARIQDAIAGWDAVLAPFNVTITEVSDPTLANLVLDNGTTSASGTGADGVLGCYNGAAGEITILQGWNWYAGTDPAQVGANQYDFQTTVTHELGHALGLGGATNPNSPMFETLATGTANRIMTAADLNIPYPPEGADPLTAAGFVSDAHGNLLSVAPGPGALAGAALSNAGHPSGDSTPFVFSGGVPVDASTVGQDANPAGPKTGLESYPTNDNPAPFKAGAASCPTPFGGDGRQRTMGQAHVRPVTTRRFDVAPANSATDASTGSAQPDMPDRRTSQRAFVDQVMRELAVDAGGVSTTLNAGDALLAVAGVQWFLGVESRERVAEENGEGSSRRRRPRRKAQGWSGPR